MKEVKFLSNRISFIFELPHKQSSLSSNIQDLILLYDKHLNPYLVSIKDRNNYFEISLHDSNLESIKSLEISKSEVPRISKSYPICYRNIQLKTSIGKSLLINPDTFEIIQVPFKSPENYICDFITPVRPGIFDCRVVYDDFSKQILIPPNTIYEYCLSGNTYDEHFIGIICEHNERKSYLVVYDLENNKEIVRLDVPIEFVKNTERKNNFFITPEGVVLYHMNGNNTYLIDYNGNIKRFEYERGLIEFTLGNYYVQTNNDSQIIIYDLSQKDEKKVLRYDDISGKFNPYNDTIIFRNKNQCILYSGIIFEIENDEMNISTLHDIGRFRDIIKLSPLKFYSIVDNTAIFLSDRRIVTIDLKSKKWSILEGVEIELRNPYIFLSEKGILSYDNHPPTIDSYCSLLTF